MLCWKFTEGGFCYNEYRTSLGSAMRAQGFALSKMKGDSKSAKFKIWDTQHLRYVQWLVNNNTIIRSFVWICYFAEIGFSVVKGAIVNLMIRGTGFGGF